YVLLRLTQRHRQLSSAPDCKLRLSGTWFGHSQAQYEKSYQSGQHDHLIDIATGKIFEFSDPRIIEIINSTQ
ncbi:MAG: transcriptional repressor, partial [Ignavibacteriales bacterium]|nr:transcriptional repressor [Ignavibacteriales bacterium]